MEINVVIAIEEAVISIDYAVIVIEDAVSTSVGTFSGIEVSMAPSAASSSASEVIFLETSSSASV